METVTGIFSSFATADQARRRLEAIVSDDKITILKPGDAAAMRVEVPATAAEQPGVGTAIGGAAGAAAGMVGGAGAAAAIAAVIPGVGPVMAIGLLGGAILGGLGGAVAGQAVERKMGEGLPEDEFFVYEDALRRGRTVLIASCDNHDIVLSVREYLHKQGAEAIDAAREMWWIGLRSAEQEHYHSKAGAKFDRDEKFYRMGFEAAQHAKYRCKEFDQILSEKQADIEELEKQYPGVDVAEPFGRGFDRGRDYYQHLCNEGGK